nr:hypothetical protein [Tanacetum cinerariifolium]
DVEGVVFLPNEEIFAGLAQMGYEKPEVAEEGIAEEQVQVDAAVAAAFQETVAEDVVEDVTNEAIPSTLTPLSLPSPPSHDIPSTTQVQSSPPHQP